MDTSEERVKAGWTYGAVGLVVDSRFIVKKKPLPVAAAAKEEAFAVECNQVREFEGLVWLI